MTTNRNCYLAIAGPTASGKSALAVEIAKRLNGEIISADSMQIYDGIYIGTARPTEEEMQGIPHHLMGFLPLSAPYSVAQYMTDANRAIDEVNARGHLPIICGGTGLYMQSLIENIIFAENATADPALRERLRDRAAKEGGEALLAELAQVDSVTAAKLHPNDLGRIIRALEVYYTNGITISEQVAQSRRHPATFDTCLIVLNFEQRERLYDRIHQRVDSMCENGLLEEAQTVLNSPYAPTAMQAIGYKELKPYFDGDIALDEALDNLKKSTRHYAKRQMSWFRRIPYAHTLCVDAYVSLSELTDAAIAIYKQHLREGGYSEIHT